ncbi:hypothetical protein IWX47DRAFT_612830 [Phyllosticta citricarpa]
MPCVGAYVYIVTFVRACHASLSCHANMEGFVASSSFSCAYFVSRGPERTKLRGETSDCAEKSGESESKQKASETVRRAPCEKERIKLDGWKNLSKCKSACARSEPEAKKSKSKAVAPESARRKTCTGKRIGVEETTRHRREIQTC